MAQSAKPEELTSRSAPALTPYTYQSERIMPMASGRKVLIVGPSSTAQGGIASVLAVYKRSGLLEKWNALQITTFREGGALLRIGLAITAICRYSAHLLFSDVALVHLHAAQRTSFFRKALFAEIARLHRCPYLFHVHGSEFDKFYQNGGRILQWFIRRTLRNAATVIALSNGWKQWFESIEPNAIVEVVYNPVDIPLAPALPADNRPQILFLGRLGQRKGVYDLLQAASLIRSSVADVQVVCAGDGEISLVQEQTKKLSLQDVVSTPGWTTGEAKEALIRSSSVFVLPSYNEGLPVSVIECMAFGLPVVTTRLRGIEDAVEHGVDGFLISAGNVVELSETLIALLKDPTLRERVGIAARAKATKKFSADATLRRLEDIYAQVGAIRSTNARSE